MNCEYYMGKDKQIGKIISLIKAYSRFGDYGDTALLTVLVIRTISTNWTSNEYKDLNTILGGLFYFEGQLEATHGSLDWETWNNTGFDKTFPSESITRV